MKCVLTLILILVSSDTTFSQQEISFKAGNEYELKIDLSFRKRDAITGEIFDAGGSRIKTTDQPIAYLAVFFKLLKSNNETRVRILNQKKVTSKKIKVNEVEKIEMGFVEDLKYQTEPSLLTILLLDDQKKEVSQVILTIEPDGTFLVNGVKRGKF